MVSARHLPNDIELLAKEDWEKGRLGQILHWILTIGRHIVIITELIVILAFLFRFKLDRDLTDLHDSIKQKQAIIEASASFEKKYRQLQKQVALLDQVTQNRLNPSAFLTHLSHITPLDVYLAEASIDQKTFTLKATALSETGLAFFLHQLPTLPSVDQVSLTELIAGSDQDPGIKFRLNSQLTTAK
jgi:Tfp pilus assembly protein PilN